MTYCAYCKCRVLDAHIKCPSCGSTTFVEEKTEPPKPAEPVIEYRTIRETIYVKPTLSERNRWVALALCLVFGVFGVHRFYVGKNATGVIYALTFGCFGIGAFIDFLMILFGCFRDKEGLVLS